LTLRIDIKRKLWTLNATWTLRSNSGLGEVLNFVTSIGLSRSSTQTTESQSQKERGIRLNQRFQLKIYLKLKIKQKRRWKKIKLINTRISFGLNRQGKQIGKLHDGSTQIMAINNEENDAPNQTSNGTIHHQLLD
jgi:hypothetical protein